MRSAGCVINDIADRNFDRLVDRTKERPLASGKLRVNEAFVVFAGLSLAGLPSGSFLKSPDHTSYPL